MPDINGIPYVESDDLVSAYPSVSQSLAQEVSDQLAAKGDISTNGAWEAWTPTTTGITVGNGTITARYMQIGKTVHFSYIFVLGSTSALVSDHSITLPVARRNTDSVGQANILLREIGVNNYLGVPLYSPADASVLLIRPATSAASYVGNGFLSGTIPFTWADGDEIICSGSYEAA